MYSDTILTDDGNQLVTFRLNQLLTQLQGQNFPTLTEAQAAVYSAVNSVLTLGNQVSPLNPVGAQGPAVVGDVTGNLALLNNDAQGIVSVLNALESDAALLFNLTAALQNQLRQQIREQVYCPTLKCYLEAFVADTNLDTSKGTASYNYDVGMASLPLNGQPVQASPSQIQIGVNSVGNLQTALSYLTDGLQETSLQWTGSQLELVFSFAQPTIINRLEIGLDDYQGLSLVALTSSPDGIVQDNLLNDILLDSQVLDGSSNKFSGDVVLDFDPRHVLQLTVLIADAVGSQQINLREINFWAQQYGSTGMVQSQMIVFPELGNVEFTTEELEADQLTSITHQVSWDGVQYTAITPGTLLQLGGLMCWYRASLARMDGNFASMAAPLDKPGQDPSQAQIYTIVNISTSSLGNNVLERTITINLLASADPSVTRVIVLNEIPMSNTLTINEGNTLLGDTVYGLAGSALTFLDNEERDNLVISYQTSAYANAGLVARQHYYTPRLYEVSFERSY